MSQLHQLNKLLYLRPFFFFLKQPLTLKSTQNYRYRYFSLSFDENMNFYVMLCEKIRMRILSCKILRQTVRFIQNFYIVTYYLSSSNLRELLMSNKQSVHQHFSLVKHDLQFILTFELTFNYQRTLRSELCVFCHFICYYFVIYVDLMSLALSS